MKIWIHIGHGKTGTTSIQKFLVDSRPELKEQGFLYPHVGQSKYSHHGLAIFQAPKMSPKILGLYQELMNEIVTEKPKTLLLSSEQFCYCKFDYIRELKDLFADYEVGVVFYVRNQVALIPSAYMQTLKHGGNYYGGIKDYFSHTKNAFLYSRRIEHWVKLFGDENLKVRL